MKKPPISQNMFITNTLYLDIQPNVIRNWTDTKTIKRWSYIKNHRGKNLLSYMQFI